MITYGTRIRSHVNRFRFPPPDIRVEHAIHNHIRENYVSNRSFIPVLNTDAAVAILNDTVIEQYVINLIHIFRTNLDGTGTGDHGTVGHHNVFARTVFLKLAAVLQADTVITRFYMAIGNAHILGMVYIDAVAIAYLQIVQNRDTINGGIIATNEMNRPIGTIADGYITDHCLLYIDKRQHMRTGIKVGHRFQLVRIFQFFAHKGDTVSVYSSCSGDRYLFQVLTINPHHAFTTVIAESAQGIGSLIGIGKQAGIRFQVQFYKRGKMERTAHESTPRRNKYRSATRLGTLVDSGLYSSGVIGHAVTFGSVIHNIVDSSSSLRSTASP